MITHRNIFVHKRKERNIVSENSVSKYLANKSPIRFGEKKKNAMAVENFGQHGRDDYDGDF